MCVCVCVCVCRFIFRPLLMTIFPHSLTPTLTHSLPHSFTPSPLHTLTPSHIHPLIPLPPHTLTGSDSGVVVQRKHDTSVQYKGHSRSHSGSHVTPLTVHKEATPPPSIAAVLTRRQASVPPRPESLMFNDVLDDLNRLTQDLDTCLVNDGTGNSAAGSTGACECGGWAGT